MGHTVADRSSKEADFQCFSSSKRDEKEKSCDAGGDSVYILRSCCAASGVAGVSAALTVADRKSVRLTVADRSSNEADFLC
jgi:hypothetical protein